MVLGPGTLYWMVVNDGCKLLQLKNNLIYKSESVYVCMYVPRPITPKFAWATRFTRAWHQARGRPKMLAPAPPTFVP